MQPEFPVRNRSFTVHRGNLADRCPEPEVRYITLVWHPSKSRLFLQISQKVPREKQAAGNLWLLSWANRKEREAVCGKVNTLFRKEERGVG